MTTGSEARQFARSDRPQRKALSGTALAVASALVVILTAAVVFGLWAFGTRGLSGNDLVVARFDALRIGLSIGVGSGGVIVLYLAWRRQRAMEDTLAHQERVAESTEDDARERRITDLYTKAADQLGSAKAAVRLAGLYALERLAQDHPKQRSTIVNVLCAYIRMPFDLPADPPMLPDKSSEAASGPELQQYRELLSDHREKVQEQEVRHAAQRILSTHSRPGSGGVENAVDAYWPGLDLDLTGATLGALDFSECYVRTLSLRSTRVSGDAQFVGAQFSGDAQFRGAQFNGDVQFDLAQFNGDANFDGVLFKGVAVFIGVKFEGEASFGAVRFGRGARFDHALFRRVAVFIGVKFNGDARFSEAQFEGDANFGHAQFGFGVGAWTDGANFANGIPRELTQPLGDVRQSVHEPTWDEDGNT